MIFRQIVSHGGSTQNILTCYGLLTVASLVHAVTFYHLVGHMGAVTAGVMNPRNEGLLAALDRRWPTDARLRVC